jgi:two-component system, OmpR family, phosphate regulon sensor histidine kinase PhoR
MAWWIQRLLVVVGLLALGGGVGGFAGQALNAAAQGVALGMLAGGGVAVALDSLAAARLVHWLRGSQEGAAPRTVGLWGELAYRIERSLRLREQATAREAGRLAQFLRAIEASPNGVLLLDARRQIEWCNAVAADQLGLDPRRDIGQPVTNLVRAPAFVGLMHEAQPRDTVSMPDVTGRGMLAALARRYGNDQMLVITQDVTERLRQEAMRRDFVANVSHEIRTPLTVLAGFVETMASLPLDDAERARVLQLMTQQTDRMRLLVTDLLLLAQLEGGPRPGADFWIPVAELFERVATEGLTLSAGRHRIAFGDPAGALVAGVDAELQSALGNLVNNAIRYTPEGGRIDIGWRLRSDGGGEFEVRDSGIGIAREHLPRLAERFYRADGSRSRDTGGTGLGLAIAKHVMQRHGGSLEIESELGAGSRFRLVLPANRVRAASPNPAAVTNEAPAGSAA